MSQLETKFPAILLNETKLEGQRTPEDLFILVLTGPPLNIFRLTSVVISYDYILGHSQVIISLRGIKNLHVFLPFLFKGKQLL